MTTMDTTTSAELEASEARFYKLQNRTAKNFGYGATEEALSIAECCYDRLAEALRTRLAEPFSPTEAGVPRILAAIAPELVALIAISNALTGAMDELPWLTLTQNVGKAINHELFAEELRLHDEKLRAKIDKWVSEKHGNLKYRLQAAKSVAKKMGFAPASTWKLGQLTAVGNFVLDLLVSALPDLFEKVPTGDKYDFRIEVTEGAQAVAQSAMKRFVRANPIFLPSVVPPVPWTDWNKGGPVDPVAQKLATVVRTRHRETVAAVKAAIKSGQMQPALDALNAVQATPWRINSYLMNVIKECQKRGIEVEGIPQREDFPIPGMDLFEWEGLDDEAKKLWRSEKESIKRDNRTLVSDRLRYEEDMETADVLAEHPQFFIPHNLDWRGREYPMTNFNFQREDRVRALFLFGEGEAIGEEGIAWLKVHLANCGDFGKVSKKSYDERIKWVDDNLAAIMDCAIQEWDHPGPLAPNSVAFWTKADKPFLFLAACVELTKALSLGERCAEYVCSLPVSWDGSCSGLQHLCAMTRSLEGELVNLTDVDTPRDVYTTVTENAFTAIEHSSDPIAKCVLAYDGDRRKLGKRNVMTFGYGSKKFGMAQQHMDDLMEPLRVEVAKKKRKEHPFGKTWAEHHAASQFLAKHIYAAIEQTVKLPAKAMEFLQDLAGLMAHEGKPLEWTTPTGLPWSNRYHESRTKPLSLWLHDAGVKRRYQPEVFAGFQKNIDKKRAVNGVAPNFVHACDAAHLLLTVLAALQEGIRHFALVHDSFGCLPSVAARFQGIIRETFVEMYETHDVLDEVLQRAKCDLSEHNCNRLPAVVDRGSLNIKEVLNAKYAFA